MLESMSESFQIPICPLPNELVISCVRSFLEEGRLHAKTEKSISNAVLGLLHSHVLSVTSIGTAWARVTGHDAKHGVKQVDRLISNERFSLEDCLRAYVRKVVGGRRSVVVALDWTEFAKVGQSTISLSLITSHGRATPLLWHTVEAFAMKERRNNYEDELLYLFKACLPLEHKIRVVVLADRGFGDAALYAELKEELGFDFVIRFRGCVRIEAENGETKRADEWFAGSGKKMLRMQRVKVTNKRRDLASFVAVHEPAMAEPWFLASSLLGSAYAIVKLYGRRFTIEETFRDQKDLRFGWGLYEVQVTQPLRRDRLLFLAAVAQLLLTLTGAAGEQLGLDAKLRVNTEKKRTHSLFRQGREYVKGLINSVAQAVQDRFIKLFQHLPTTTAFYATI
jgi:Transposase DDE domain